jgi:ADP-ribose pyrophosphatase YjhB (NUDIX family)
VIDRRVIGRRLRPSDLGAVARGAVAHGMALLRGRYRRTVGALALIRDHDGRILVALTTYPPRVWNLPGGRIETPERITDGLRREVREETGLEVAVERLLVVDATHKAGVSFVFACRVTAGEPKPGAGEIRALRWLDPVDVPRLARRVRVTLEAALEAEAESSVRYRG